MQPGRASQTAVLVAMGRAAADGATDVARFSDPTAMALLPDEARRRVEAYRTGPPPRTLREGWSRGSLKARAAMMVARTVAVDDAIRAAGAPQLVILGAGLDGRAWRMSELADTVAFEVDHPDTQRDKRVRVSSLRQVAREVRFVPVDFERDDFEKALAVAGHDPTRPTTWVWEGVVMYLRRRDIEATMRVIARRSPPGSRLIIVYVAPGLMASLIGWIVGRLGETFRSAFRPAQMRALLAAHGFSVTNDEDIPSTAAALSPVVAHDARLLKHLRTVVADRAR
jgi:methyltransferase (TIGR00027 family)